MERKSVIFDLDGTLANINVRRSMSYKKDGNLNWGIFNDPENIQFDLPNEAVINAYKLYQNSGHRMIIFSGRSSATKEKTIEWLESNGITFDKLYMRPDEKEEVSQLSFKFPGFSIKPPDIRYIPDDDLKLKWLKEEFPGDKIKNLVCTYDDRDKVVNMWRENGITCFQVDYGDF